MKSKLTKESFKRLLAEPGKVRGVVFRTDADYVRKNFGEVKLKKVEARFKELGKAFSYDKIISSAGWHPFGLRIASLLIIKEVLGLTKQELFEMGDASPKLSFLVKALFKAFTSPKTALKKGPVMWKQHYQRGQLVIKELKSKSATLYLEGIGDHPLFAKYLQGYFRRFIQLAVRKGSVECELVIKKTGEPVYFFNFKW